MDDEWRRRLRREAWGKGDWSTGTACDEFAGTVGNTAARMEEVGVGKKLSVLEERSGLFGMNGSSMAERAVLFGMFSSARSTERQSRRTWRK